ncbi:MAG: hypothetical protein A2583_07870 [Bdellovibrionales bacterium RIFOXYD1_FULL_53_11]|nr:MAG: hypothetical protein A2583_07870 [Bdellovibrionales bacterium RIFOXYD1_FULL_53_11]
MTSHTKLSGGSHPPRARLDRIFHSLEGALGTGMVLSAKEVLETYAEDDSGFGAFQPDFVIRARNTQDVSIILKEASREGVPVVPRGGGTGRVGGALAVYGGIVLSLEKMNRITAIENENFLARVEPGMILEKFHQSIEEAGLFYPPDPSSLDSCSVGGNVACNAGGPRALKYGVTSNYVLGAEFVLPDGTILKTGRSTVKGGAGYELHKLIVGSEGTLGVITGITFKLVAKPSHIETALITFPTARAALQSSQDIMKSGILPRSLEFMDALSLAAARTKVPRQLPETAGGCLLVELDGSSADTLLEEMGRVAEICDKHGSGEALVAQDEAQRRDLWTVRREVAPALREMHPCRVSEDIVVPRAALAGIVDELQTTATKHGIKIAAFGHSGDGNIHVTVLYDEPTREAADAACTDTLRLAVKHGGTVAGEHGTGIQKVGALALEQSAELLEFQRGLKKYFDPAGIMNPGKVVAI